MKPAVFAFGLIAALVSGCNVDWFHEPRPPALTVENRTDKDIRLYYLRNGTELPDINVAPGASTTDSMPFGLESATCVSGSILAKDGSTVVARIDRPCAGTTWTIKVGGSAAPS